MNLKYLLAGTLKLRRRGRSINSFQEMAKQSDNEPSDSAQPEWLSYEQLAAKLLNDIAHEFGLQSVEGKQKVQGFETGDEPVIDAKGITEEGFYIIECKHYGSRRVQKSDVGYLAYQILDTRADGAILVSTMGLQAGSEKIAKARNIISVQLTHDSTLADFVMRFLDKLRIGFSARSESTAAMRPRFMRTCKKCGEKYPSEEHDNLCGNCR
jgi:Restriction endonuclease